MRELQVELVRARAEQAPELSEIARLAKSHWGYPENWLGRWREALTLTPDFVERHPVYVAEVRGRIAGFYAMVGSGPLLELEHLWIAPAQMGRGLGRRLLEHAVEQARSLGAVAIETNSDPHAEGFYSRMGATRIGRVPAPLEGHEERFLPRLRLEIAPRAR